MELLDVPEVRQLPELTGGEESPTGFADMVLTSLLAYDAAVLFAESTAGEPSVSWRLHPREEDFPSEEFEIAVSPSLESFRLVLTRFGHHYLGDQLYNGYALRFLRQCGRVHRCHFYISNTGESGFWIRLYATRAVGV